MNKISGKYCIEIDNTRTLFLDLNNKGQYNMEIIREADFGSDIENVDIISFGYYKIDSNILLLKDLNLKMEMRFCKEKDSLIICIEGFEYLKNKELKYFGASDIHDWLFDKNNFSLDF
jgi:hypothetical protein